MPRTRIDTDRDAKIDEILDAAERQLHERGLAGLSIAGIARSLGVAQNSIYWYFPSRDHLLVAALHRIAKGWLHELAELGSERYIDQIVGAIDRLATFEPLATLVTHESRASSVLAEFGQEFERSLCSLLRETLRPHVPERRLEITTETVLTLARGALARDLEPPQRRDLLTDAISHLVEANAGAARSGTGRRRV